MTSSVDSRISPKRYESLLSEIEEEDQNSKSDLYELSIYDHVIHISPGKTIRDEDIKDLVYCYVYAVKQDKVVQKLGVYEKFTKEKEEFFDLSTFDKGTLCLFEKYETNRSLLLEFKVDTAPKTVVKSTVPKSKKKSAKAEEPVEVDLNAPEAETKEEPEEPEAETKVEEDEDEPEPVETTQTNPEVDLNAPETKPEPTQTNPEVDLNAPETKPVTKPVTKPPVLDAETLGEPAPKKAPSKIRMKKTKPEAETKPEVEAETKAKPKTRTKKTKAASTDLDEALGTKFG